MAVVCIEGARLAAYQDRRQKNKMTLLHLILLTLTVATGTLAKNHADRLTADEGRLIVGFVRS